MLTYFGSCHCQAVRFSIEAKAVEDVYDCNCSLCAMTGFLHLIVPESKFKLLTSESHLSCYQFNTQVARHYFCRHCGVKSFYRPRSNPDGIDVNWRCLELPRPEINIVPFDGVNWEANVDKVRHKSEESGTEKNSHSNSKTEIS